MCQCTHQCFYTLQVVTSSGSVNLPNAQRIRENRVISIQIPDFGSTQGYGANGADAAPNSVLAGGYLYLKDATGFTLCDPIPLWSLLRNSNSPEPLKVNYEKIDPEASVITLNTSASGYSATDVIPIVFELSCTQCQSQ
jgi:hypothetical protein